MFPGRLGSNTLEINSHPRGPILQLSSSISPIEALFVFIMNWWIALTPSSPISASHMRRDFNKGKPFASFVEFWRALQSSLASNSQIFSLMRISCRSSPSSRHSSVLFNKVAEGTVSNSLQHRLYNPKKFSVGFSSSSFPLPFPFFLRSHYFKLFFIILSSI